jgi:5-methylcytosine-specific restriction endonuclease McrA
MPRKDPEARRAYRKRYSAEHSQEAVEEVRQWRLANPGRRNKQERERYAIHPEIYNQRNHKYRQAHPEIGRAACQRRDARIRGASICDFTIKQWVEMKIAYGHRCAYCHRKMKRLERDHITPLSKGGAHTRANIVPACRSCNASKNAGPPLKPVQPLLL